MTEARSVHLHPADNVAVAVDNITQGAQLRGLVAKTRVPKGHKIALAGIAPGKPVLKFGQIIGFATKPIEPGEWVHEQNTAMGDFDRDYAFCADAKPMAMVLGCWAVM